MADGISTVFPADSASNFPSNQRKEKAKDKKSKKRKDSSSDS